MTKRMQSIQPEREATSRSAKTQKVADATSSPAKIQKVADADSEIPEPESLESVIQNLPPEIQQKIFKQYKEGLYIRRMEFTIEAMLGTFYRPLLRSWREKPVEVCAVAENHGYGEVLGYYAQYILTPDDTEQIMAERGLTWAHLAVNRSLKNGTLKEDANALSKRGWAPLHFARSRREIELLAEHGAIAEGKVENRNIACTATPLYHAIRMKRSLEIIGAHVKITPAKYIRSCARIPLVENDLDVVQILLEDDPLCAEDRYIDNVALIALVGLRRDSRNEAQRRKENELVAYLIRRMNIFTEEKARRYFEIAVLAERSYATNVIISNTKVITKELISRAYAFCSKFERRLELMNMLYETGKVDLSLVQKAFQGNELVNYGFDDEGQKKKLAHNVIDYSEYCY